MEQKERLQREFFTRDGLAVARELLGKILVHETPLGTVRGIITETESYMGETDKASHAYGGKRTRRTEPMYHIGGTSYVYLIYGMYDCMNIAAMTEGIPQAVLIRGAEPADGLSAKRMEILRLRRAKRRGGKLATETALPEGILPGNVLPEESSPKGILPDGSSAKSILPGRHFPEESSPEEPSRLRVPKHLADGPGKLCIAMGITREDNDRDLVTSPDFYVTEGIPVLPGRIRTGKRIGVDYAQEAAEYPWRFFL
ncbi:MAG: DNA-3-methyladenine glycosylase [Clostridium sp.]|jgi:DNA-3-methyladenine glycosylase|nr:DNA-3-methyladenine glycosylase [Clostridium sp.]